MTSYFISVARLLLLVSISAVALSRNAAASESKVLRYSILEETGPATKYVGDLLMDVAALQGITKTNSTPVPVSTNRRREQMALLPGKYQHLFSIDPLSGVLMTRGAIDRELVCAESSMTSASCVLNVEVAVIRPVESFRAFNVQITIEDINDNPPKFDQEHYTIHISESALPEVGVYPLPPARDIDWGRFSVQSYVLRPSSRSDTFALRVMSENLGDGDTSNNVGSPSLILMKSLDYETRSRYDMELVAFDGGRPRKSGTLAISVVVIDVNDNNPQFDQKSYETNVLETADPTVPILRVQAKDNDDASNGKVSYRLTDQSREQHGNQFKINNITGEISLVRRFDTEYRDIYVLVVAAEDAGSEPRSSIARITINVEDVNQHPPTVTIDPLTQSGRAEVVENKPIDEFVAYVSAEDADRGVNGQVICNVTSEIFSMHLVHRNLYKLSTAVTFDREAVDRYIAVVRCTDLGTPSLASTHGIEVHVLDDNDNIPQFSRRVFEVGVMENSPIGRSVLTVSAWDVDVGLNAEVRYSLAGNNNSVLNIDPVTGVLTVGTKGLDHESTAEIELMVTASDQGNPARSATAIVRVSVLNENDCTPGFTQSTFSFGVFENLPPGTEVGTVSAIDPDMPPYNDFFYLLQTSSLTKNGDPSFIVDSVTGKITTSTRLDREQTSVYYLTALAIDSHNTSFVTSIDVIVYVADKNDNQPYIIFPSTSNNTVHVSTYASVGYTVTRILASDADIGFNAMLVYGLLLTATVPPTEESTSFSDLVGWSSPLPFDVDANNGAVYLTRSLRQLTSRDYVVVVTVSDRGSPTLSTSATLIVRIDDSLSYAISQSLLSPTGGALGGTTDDGSSGRLVSLSDLAFNQQVLVIMAAVTAIVVMLLVAAIVFVRRRQLQQRERHCETLVAKETVSSSLTPTSVALSTVSGDVTTQGWELSASSLTQYNHTCNIPDSYSPVANATYTPPLMQQLRTVGIPFDMQVGVPAKMGDSSTYASTTSDSGRGQSESDDLTHYNQSMSTFLPRSIQCLPKSQTPYSGVFTSSTLLMSTSTSQTVSNGSMKFSANGDNYCSFIGDDNCCTPRTYQHHYGNNLSLIDDVRKPIGVKTYKTPPDGAVTLTSNQPSYDRSYSLAGGGEQCNMITPSNHNDGTLSADRCQNGSAASPPLGRQHRTLDKTASLNHPRSWSATSSMGLAHPLVTVRVAPLIATAATSSKVSSPLFDTTNTKQSSSSRRRLPPLPPVLVASARQEPVALVSRPSHLDIEKVNHVVMSTISNTDSIVTVGSDDGASSTSGSFVMYLQAAQSHRQLQQQQQQQQFGKVYNRPEPDRRVCVSDL